MSENWLTLFLLNLRYFGATRSEHAQNRQDKYQDLITHLREGRSMGIPTCRVLQGMVSSNSITLGLYLFNASWFSKSHSPGALYIDAQDQTPLPIWRPEAYFKYPDGGDLKENLRFSVYWNSSDRAFSVKEQSRSSPVVAKRTIRKIFHDFQKDTY